MGSLPRIVVATSSATIRLIAFLFLRWIPGHHFPPIVFTSLAVYLSTLPSLIRQGNNGRNGGKDQDSKNRKSSGQGGPGAIKALLTGLPSARSPWSTRLTVLINVIVSLLTLDFLVRGLVLYPSTDAAISRIGYISPTTANLLVREPDPAQLPLYVYYQEANHEADAAKWIEEGIVYALDDTSDFTAKVAFKNLKPSSPYRYSLSNNMTGTFITAPLPGSESATRLSFLTSSCIKANFPYNPLSHPLRIPGIEQMSETIAKLPSLFRPAFMLFLGDFIYIDVPQRFGSSISHYRSEYRRVYSSPSWTIPNDGPAIDLPWLHTLDDHEIANDWSQGNTTAPYPAAADPYVHYHVSVNPPIPPMPFAKPENTTYFSFINGPASFFMMDTRTYRSEPSQANSTILGSAQLQSLLEYIGRPEPAEVRWKFVASSVPMTKNWPVGNADTWGGFLHERRTVFEAMWRAERELGVRIVMLSGDRHEFGATRFPDPTLGLTPDELAPNSAGEGLHEFSVGPLSMFYIPVGTYQQTDNEDVTIKYTPTGNFKYGLIDIANYDEEIDTPSGTPAKVPSSVLTYSLYIDGEVVWKYRLSVPLVESGGLMAASSAKHPRLPPGRVLLDEVTEGWEVAFQEFLGKAEEIGASIWRQAVDQYYELLEKAGKAERV
ncbi:hypothetical protein ASPWEDRAFT_115239 [Aspergillus wentii DTO 134E9]|uniref:PhoD-like phosphatase metallophosphatase domain-containing protein n=1 Tax=Aspergillus wentii DTO 134E9 TaxID=1073089 RepID=A0A1L9RDT8_ASPWE|nr:uncharacterized protein ASPWEDRAFT_115239 [Aspergillus wentii DTO 134E9]OJJ33048.1 hypothetical protein ASPWEDRAFT_115239 [Aspergillus wentii DTO 134E9]